jgi:hypothetical protein
MARSSNDASDAASAAKKIRKAGTKRKAAEAEPDDDAVQDEVEEQEEQQMEQQLTPAQLAEKEKKRKAKMAKLAANKRAALARKLAREAGGTDVLQNAISLLNAKRMLTWTPTQVERGSYAEEEMEARMELSKERITTSAARETQVRVEALLRNVVEKAVQRAIDDGRVSVDARAVYQVLREYEDALSFTGALPPLGLLRCAQGKGAIPRNEADKDEEAIAKEAQSNKALFKKIKAAQKAVEEQKQKARAARAARADA